VEKLKWMGGKTFGHGVLDIQGTVVSYLWVPLYLRNMSLHRALARKTPKEASLGVGLMLSTYAYLCV
jgi:hypothetical protein